MLVVVKKPPANTADLKRSELDPWVRKIPEESMATHSSTLAWRSRWTEEPSGLRSIGSQRTGRLSV